MGRGQFSLGFMGRGAWGMAAGGRGACPLSARCTPSPLPPPTHTTTPTPTPRTRILGVAVVPAVAVKRGVSGSIAVQVNAAGRLQLREPRRVQRRHKVRQRRALQTPSRRRPVADEPVHGFVARGERHGVRQAAGRAAQRVAHVRHALEHRRRPPRPRRQRERRHVKPGALVACGPRGGRRGAGWARHRVLSPPPQHASLQQALRQRRLCVAATAPARRAAPAAGPANAGSANATSATGVPRPQRQDARQLRCQPQHKQHEHPAH